jgi:hypothetical protein
MPNSDVPRKNSALTVTLDASLLARLERYAEQNLISVNDLVRTAILQTLARDTPKSLRKVRPMTQRPDEAPLDAFLPEGVDPFSPAEAVLPAPAGLASNFEDIQARMRFAGTPALLRDFG